MENKSKTAIKHMNAMTHYNFGHNLDNLRQIFGFPYESYSENWQQVLEASANIIWFHLVLANTTQKHTFTHYIYNVLFTFQHLNHLMPYLPACLSKDTVKLD